MLIKILSVHDLVLAVNSNSVCLLQIMDRHKGDRADRLTIIHTRGSFIEGIKYSLEGIC